MNQSNGQQPTPEQMHKMQVISHASQILHSLLENGAAAEGPVEDVVELSFNLAIAFDKKANEFARPPAIVKPPNGMRIT